MRAALAAASACDGAAVYFPPGGYYFAATVAVPDGVSLVGGPGLRSHMQVRNARRPHGLLCPATHFTILYTHSTPADSLLCFVPATGNLRRRRAPMQFMDTPQVSLYGPVAGPALLFEGTCGGNSVSSIFVMGQTVGVLVGLYPIVTFQYSSTTLFQVSYHIR